jgi:LmbE family N-acetylglucosaminyl deacetylase
VPSSTEWAFGQFAMGFQANVFIDISTTLEKKIEAMEIYESEARSFPHPRSPEALRALAKRWGATTGLKAAEAFGLIREIR